MIGYHVNKGKDYLASIAEAFEFCDTVGIATPCAQIFARGPQGYRSCLEDAAAAEIGRRWPQRVLIHGAYVDYMNGKPAGIANISSELATCDLARGMGVVVHLGASMKLAESLPPAMVGTSSRVYLEINAMKPPGFTTPETLAEIFGQIDSTRLGLCIDTQHLYACGVALRTDDDAADYIARVRDAINVPLAFHLNDSAVPLGSGRDRHEELLHGELYRGYSAEAAAAIGADPVRHFADSGAAEILRSGFPVILESKSPRATLTELAALRPW